MEVQTLFQLQFHVQKTTITTTTTTKKKSKKKQIEFATTNEKLYEN